MPWYSCRRCGEVERFSDDAAAAAARCSHCGLANGSLPVKWERVDDERVKDE